MNTSSMNDESSILYPLVFPLDCRCRNCSTFVLAASGDVQGRLADEGILRPALQKGHTQAYSVVV